MAARRVGISVVMCAAVLAASTASTPAPMIGQSSAAGDPSLTAPWAEIQPDLDALAGAFGSGRIPDVTAQRASTGSIRPAGASPQPRASVGTPANVPAPPRTDGPLATPVEAPAPPTAGPSATYTGRVVIKLTTPADAGQITRTAESAGTRVDVDSSTATGATVVTVDGDAVTAAARIAAQPGVAYAVPERRFTAATVAPDDPAYGEQWDLVAMKVPTAWASTDGTGATVAVIDTGRLDHPDLAGRYLPGYDFISDIQTAQDGTLRDSDPTDAGDWAPAGACGSNPQDVPSSWHGLHVSSTVAAITGNGKGIAGIASGARILPLRVLGRCGGSSTDVADAVVWAAGGEVPGVPSNPHPATIINVSLGGRGMCTQVEQGAIDAATARGALVVVAAGNDGRDVAGFTPANCRGVLVVGASDRAGSPGSFSNRGPAVGLSAPGVSISGLSNSGQRTAGATQWSVASRTGTSMAAPHVSAVAALMWSLAPQAGVAQIRQSLLATVSPFRSATVGHGVGIVDAAAAVAAIRPAAAPPRVSGLSAPGARSAGGSVVTVTGTGLAGASVLVGGRAAAILSSSATSLVVRVPAGTAGTTTLVVRTNAGSASAPFFYDNRYVVGRRGRIFTPTI